MEDQEPNPPVDVSSRLKWLFGETLVIVLGVMIALAVDRAVQSADRDEFERTQLRSLASDFEEATQMAAAAAESARWRDGLGRDLLRTIEGEAPEGMTGQRLAEAIEFPSWHYLPPFPRETWEDLINTGQLGAISNPKIRRAVSRFYRSVDQVTTFHADWILSSQRFRHDTTLILPARTRMALTESFVSSTELAEGDVPPMQELIEAVRAHPDLAAHLSHALLANEVAVGIFSQLESDAKQVTELVQTELRN